MPRTEQANEQIREQRRRQLVQCAARVFATKGLAATKIADIAEAGEMSQGLIYRYFETKEELFTATVAQATGATPFLVEETRRQPGSALAKLGWLTAQLLPYQQQQPECAMVILQALIGEAVPQAAQQLALQHSQSLQKLVMELVVAGQQAGQIIGLNPTQLTNLYLASLQGLAATASFLNEMPDGFPDQTTLLSMFEPRALSAGENL